MLKPVSITGLRSSRSHQAGPAWLRHADSAMSHPLEASTCLNLPSLLPSLKMSQPPSLSRAYEFAHFTLYEVIIFRHELLAGMGSEQVLHSFFTMSKIKSHPKTCSYHTVKKTTKKLYKCRNWPDFHLQQEDTGFIWVYNCSMLHWTIIVALLCLAWSTVL